MFPFAGARHAARSSSLQHSPHLSIAVRYKSKIKIPLRCHIPLESIPKHIQKKINKAERYLNSLGVHIEKIQMPPATVTAADTATSDAGDGNENSMLDQVNPLIVGSLHQYPQIAHYNLAAILQIFGKSRLTKKSWSFDAKIQEKYGLPLSTALDYYPFTNTLKADTNSNTLSTEKKKKHKTTSKTTSPDGAGGHNTWKHRKNGYNVRGSDSFDSKLPLLTRSHGDDDDNEQSLVVYRDAPYDMHGLIAVIPVINDFDPDIVVFEYGRMPFFDTYIEKKSTFSNLALPIKKLWASVLFTRVLRIGAGHLFFELSKRLYKNETTSYAFESALDFVTRMAAKTNRRKIPILAGDLHHKVTDTLRVFNDLLDQLNIATLLHYGIVDERFIKASTRTKLGDELVNVIQMRLCPHATAMNAYRNDMLAAVLNELSGEQFKKILLVSHPLRLHDLFDKLCGTQPIHSWIKTMDDEHVLMKKLNLYEYERGMIHSKNTHLRKVDKHDYDECIRKAIQYLGYAQTAFLLLPYPLQESVAVKQENSNEILDADGQNGNKTQQKVVDFSNPHFNEQEFVDQLKAKIDDVAMQIRHKYGTVP